MYLISSVPSGRSYGGRRCRSTSCLCPFRLTALVPWSVVLFYDKVWDVFRWKQGIRSVFQRIQKIRTLLLSGRVRILLLCTSRDSNPGPTDQERKPPVRLNLWKLRVIVIFNQNNVIFHSAISALFVGFCSEKHLLHVLKPCKIRAETVHLLPDKLKTTSSDNDLTALVRVTAHQKSSLGGYDYDKIAFLSLQHGHQPGGSPI